MSQPQPKSFSGRKHRVWCGKTLAINSFWWLTYFKSILTSLQTLQCILCLPHIKHNFIRTTPPLRQNQILGATWLATTRVLPKVRERTLKTRLLVLIIYVRYTAISKSFIKSKTSTIKKKSFFILRTSLYRGSLCRGSSVYTFQILSSLWTGSLFGEKNSKESSPLDQRPVHRLNSYCWLYWIYLLKIFFLLD